MFTATDWSAALYIPPVDHRLVLKSALSAERIGLRVSRAFAGVILVEARKELIAPVGKVKVSRGIHILVPNRGTTFEGADPNKGLGEDQQLQRRGIASIIPTCHIPTCPLSLSTRCDTIGRKNNKLVEDGAP